MLNVTQILSRISAGSGQASSELLPIVYDELRNLANHKMASERADHTLAATALVHEAYVRLVDVGSPQAWDSRGHFFSAAAEAMRRILIDHARKRTCQKRGGGAQRVPMTDFLEEHRGLEPEQLLELDDTLQKLEKHDQAVAELVRLRVFAGLSVREAADAMQLSRMTAYEFWDFAMAWFAIEMPD